MGYQSSTLSQGLIKMKLFIFLFALLISSAFAQVSQIPASASTPGGAASGDLCGDFPSPTVCKVGGVSLSDTFTCSSVGGVMTVQTDGKISCSPLPAPPVTDPGIRPNQTSAGCKVGWTGTGLVFEAGQCAYSIGGIDYISPVTSITLDAADATNPRLDAVVVNVSGQAVKKTGTAAVSPAIPSIDPATELYISNGILVSANATTPNGVSLVDIYEENTEWTSAVTTNFNAASTTSPYRGSKAIRFSSAVVGNYVTLTKPASGTVDVTAYNTLMFYLNPCAAWPTGNGGSNSARYLAISWLNGSTQIGQPVLVRDGTFNFSSSTASAQQIAIPTSSFGTAQALVTTLKIAVVGVATGSNTICGNIDAVTLQGGVGASTFPTTSLNFKQTWLSTAAYNVNDMVVSDGIGYIALLANTGVAVTDTNTWAKTASKPTHSFVCNIGNATGTTVITTGDTGCYSNGGSYTGTITRADIIGNAAALATCSITVDVWLASGAYPTSSDKISASAPAALSSAKTNFNFAKTSWTTTVPSNPVWGASVASVTGCVYAQVRVEFQ